MTKTARAGTDNFPFPRRYYIEEYQACSRPWVTRWEQSLLMSLLLPSEKHDYIEKFIVDGLLWSG